MVIKYMVIKCINVCHVFKGLDSVGYSDVPCVFALGFQQLSIGDVCFWTPARCYFVCLEVLQYSRGLFPKHQGPETLEELATQM